MADKVAEGAAPSDPGTEAAVAVEQLPMPSKQKAKYDWYQTETQVVVTIMQKNVKPENLTVNIEEKSLSATIRLPSGSDYSLELDLAHTIVPQQSLYKILSTKVEVKLKKEDGIRWTTLEDDGTAKVAVKQFNTDQEAQKYPTSSHYTRDWDKIVSEVKEEEKNEKLEGDQALNSLFQKIYCDGSDEVKKAMNKSFMESGGTVLSTNWKEVAEKEVEIKPPDGMEYKKYEK